MNDVLVGRALTKRFGQTTALGGVDITVPAGEAVAILSWSSAGQPKEVIPSTRLVAALCAQGIGDVDASGALEASDASCAFEVFLAGQAVLPGCNAPTTTCEVSSADVDCSGSVTPATWRRRSPRSAD